MQRIDPDRSFDVLELGRAEIDDFHVEPAADLTIGVLGETDRARRGNPLEPGGDIDGVAHQIAIGLLDDIAEMDADAKFDALLRRQAGIATDRAVLDFDGAAHGVDDATELDERAIAGQLDGAAVMHGDGRVDEVAAESPEPRERLVLIGPGESAVADHVGDQDRSDLARLAHGEPLRLED